MRSMRLMMPFTGLLVLVLTSFFAVPFAGVARWVEADCRANVCSITERSLWGVAHRAPLTRPFPDYTLRDVNYRELNAAGDGRFTWFESLPGGIFGFGLLLLCIYASVRTFLGRKLSYDPATGTVVVTRFGLTGPVEVARCQSSEIVDIMVTESRSRKGGRSYGVDLCLRDGTRVPLYGSFKTGVRALKEATADAVAELLGR